MRPCPPCTRSAQRFLSEQTGSSDVTAQVVDLNARLTNLRPPRPPCRRSLGRAIAIADVIAVETQLSNVQGQIEEITAEINQLKNQAAMSTLTVTFQLPAQTVTTQATQDWTIGNQIDQSRRGAVRIGQGLATIGVWILIVVLPLRLRLSCCSGSWRWAVGSSAVRAAGTPTPGRDATYRVWCCRGDP